METHEGEVRSFYTGEWMDEKKAKNRPVAVMTENTHVTLPQYGIGNADIIYECPVEGGITRLMTIYQDYASLKKWEMCEAVVCITYTLPKNLRRFIFMQAKVNMHLMF